MRRHLLVPLLTFALLGAACGDDEASPAGGVDRADADRPTIVATTSILGDVVTSLLGDAATVRTIMPPGSDPHDFQASARQAAELREADLVVSNGADFEIGLRRVLESAARDGVTVHEALSAVTTLELGAVGLEHDHDDEHAQDDEHAHEDDHAGEDGADDHGHDHGDGSVDPHFFTDPARMHAAAEGILAAALEAAPALDTEEVRATASAYLAELEALDAEVEEVLATVPAERRVLVTNHDVFAYFADRYGFEVAGTVIPGGSTAEGASAASLSKLVEVVRREQVPAIFADTSAPARLARTLADEVGDVKVVELFSESLGEPGSGGETYVEMMRTNARRIAGALG